MALKFANGQRPCMGWNIYILLVEMPVPKSCYESPMVPPEFKHTMRARGRERRKGKKGRKEKRTLEKMKPKK